MNNLEIEVKSTQALLNDKYLEAKRMWEICLQGYGSNLQLMFWKKADTLNDSDWIEGCEYFHSHVLNNKNLERGDEIDILNNEGIQLARLKVKHKFNSERTSLTMPFASTVRLSHAEKGHSKVLHCMKEGKDQINAHSNPGIICFDTTTEDLTEIGGLDPPYDELEKKIENRFTQNDYNNILGFVLFRRNSPEKNILVLNVFPNRNSILHKDNRELFQKALAIFSDKQP